MEALPEDLRAFLQNQPFLELSESKKIRCTLNGHELPCNLAELQNFISGKKFQKLSTGAQFNYSQYEPHLVPSTKQPNHLFCKLTLRHINRVPQHVLRHVNGKRFKRALAQYEECTKQGVAFVPARLRQKRQKKTDDVMDGKTPRGAKHKQDSGIWAPSDSEDEGSDSEDSMSDLYPSTMFTLKKTDGRHDEGEGEDDFQTDDDDNMEISEMGEEKQVEQKRKKVQSGGFKKKFKKNRKRKGFKAVCSANKTK